VPTAINIVGGIYFGPMDLIMLAIIIQDHMKLASFVMEVIMIATLDTFFLNWYSGVITDHVDQVLSLATLAFDGAKIVVKVCDE
jgi:hypothetical protein